MFGWSILEGIGAALVLPALVALVAGNYKGADRAIAYGVLGGVAGAGIAVGPILGGWMTTDFTWRLVFVGEVVVALGILAGTRLIREPERERGAPGLDWVGSVLSASGLALVVFGVLQASNWGWLAPRDSPIEPFGFALTPFVIAAGGLVLAGFAAWEQRREGRGLPPLVHLGLLRISSLRGGVSMLLAQNLILMGIFFTIPLYLQIVQGLDALETGVQMLPASVGLFLTAIAGSALATRFAARTLVRVGLLVVLAAIAMLLGTIEPELDSGAFLAATGVLGVGMGLIVSQLGNVVQSAVGDDDRSEAGGLQNTAQQLGSSLGTALLGAIVISGLIAAFTANIADDPRVSDDVEDQVAGAAQRRRQLRLLRGSEGGGRGRRHRPGRPSTPWSRTTKTPQLKALKTAFLFAAFLVLASFWTTRRLPTRRFERAAGGPRSTARRARRRLSRWPIPSNATPDRPPSAPPPARPPAPPRRARATASGGRPPTGRTRSSCSSARPPRGWASCVPLRYGRMLASPFAFYRGAAAVMAADLAPTPRSGLETQLCGDAHLSNFGAFASPERRLVFDLNDFDETLPGPWEWDVKRLVASFSLAGRDRGCGEGERRRIVQAAAREYRETMRRLARMGNLESWYQQLDADSIAARWVARWWAASSARQLRARRRQGAGQGQQPGLREADRGSRREAAHRQRPAPDRADRRAGRRRRRRRPMSKRSCSASSPTIATRSTVERRAVLDGYRLVDAAFKVVGVGSVGTRAWIALMLGRDQRRPALPPGQGSAALGAGALRGAEPVRAPGRARRPRPAVDAGRERHHARLGAGRGASTASSATSTCASSGTGRARHGSRRWTRVASPPTRRSAA